MNMGFLQNYKQKECKTWIGKYFQRLTFTWIYKMYTAIALVLIGAFGFNFVDEGSILEGIVSGLYAVGLMCFVLLALFVFGYLIWNGIEAFIKWIKKK